MVKHESNWQIFEEFPPIVYMGIDCSSKAVHAVLIDSTETVLAQGKWSSKTKDFSLRILEIAQKFE